MAQIKLLLNLVQFLCIPDSRGKDFRKLLQDGKEVNYLGTSAPCQFAPMVETLVAPSVSVYECSAGAESVTKNDRN